MKKNMTSLNIDISKAAEINEIPCCDDGGNFLRSSQVEILQLERELLEFLEVNVNATGLKRNIIDRLEQGKVC